MSVTESDALLIRGGAPLRGDVRVGPDQAILETTLAVAALARGSSQLHGVIATPQLEVALAAWRQLGVRGQLDDDRLSVESPGLDALSAPTGAIECGMSARLLAQLSGVLCAQQFGTQLRAAANVRVDHWIEVLRARGAHIASRSGIPAAGSGAARAAQRGASPHGAVYDAVLGGEDSVRSLGEGPAHGGAVEAAPGGDAALLYPPVSVAPLLASERLQALDASLPFSDAVGKDAILLNALFAAGPTVLSEPHVSSDHLERAFVEVGLPLRRIG
ncbi:MAG TPA: hypothetical protein VMF89_13205, partial [Polyangiales bacterium]|nr:hypothetical protein [Polyangiales bacterium]